MLPQLVLNLVAAMFDLVDALAALQQAVSLPTKLHTGTWDWTLTHVAGAWAALLLQSMRLADATAAHLQQPTRGSAEELLIQVSSTHTAYWSFMMRGSHLTWG